MNLGPLLGRGRTAEVYDLNHGTILKLFFEWYEPDAIEEEYRISKEVSSTALSTPMVHGMVQLGCRGGIIYERVEGETMLQVLAAKPWVYLKMARELAKEHAHINACNAAGLPHLTNVLETGIKRADLPEPLRQQVLTLLYALPDGYQTLCHGDFHPDNIMVSSHGLVVIDWNNASLGHPLADAARTSIMLGAARISGKGPANWALNMFRRLFHDEYVRHYLSLTGFSRQELNLWKVPVAAARLAENVPGEKTYLTAVIQHLLQRR